MSEAALKCLIDFLCDCSRLQELEIRTRDYSGRMDSLMQFVFVNAREQGIWRDIRSVEITVLFDAPQWDTHERLFVSMEGHQQQFAKWWKEFTVTEKSSGHMVMVRASR